VNRLIGVEADMAFASHPIRNAMRHRLGDAERSGTDDDDDEATMDDRVRCQGMGPIFPAQRGMPVLALGQETAL
jgi:hypothetical protein